MKSVERTRDGTGDATPARECYRCDRDVAPSQLFRVDVEPPDALAREYRPSMRYCCPDCAAAMNLSEFSDWMKSRPRRGVGSGGE
ncbi:hypothetical protein C479_15257 [Halovivax asiaticus JCM 14624]|uniref:Uncharacterized protein n=1 Tax=Halovivax asiaticus JCM 14624 TaxID=1227490 RepID=M0BA33_9EURY|nr:hypothetical protein [Halovivax asiaticus]ELZ07153.1 hypothetical protein C479_15257 [Halovivax asiaticus JCM 14624]